MTIREKIEYSSDECRFTLYKEGLFYKCYNEDAMLFVERVRAYKVTKKFIKSAGRIVYSLGFPILEVRKGKLRLEYIGEKVGAIKIEDINNNIVFFLDKADVKGNYNKWSEALNNETDLDILKEPLSSYISIDALDSIVNMIRDFDLANSTPMQGLNFIQQLQNKLTKRVKSNGNI